MTGVNHSNRNTTDNTSAYNNPKDSQQYEPNDLNAEEKDLWRSILSEATTPPPVNNTSNSGNANSIHPAIAIGLTGAFLANAAILLSLPPVIRGKGAPFLPTATKGLDAMFDVLRAHPRVGGNISTSSGFFKTRESSISKNMLHRTHNNHTVTATPSNENLDAHKNKHRLQFVDLGSGDGRVVFRAAREGMFDKCIGYEINPVLHTFAKARRFLQAPRYWNNTNFHLQDLWSVDLSNADVVAVYGLHPIMNDLGLKMKKEMKPGSLVVSNVFVIPGWKTMALNSGHNFSSSSVDGVDGDEKKSSESRSAANVHVYSIPECFGEKHH